MFITPFALAWMVGITAMLSIGDICRRNWRRDTPLSEVPDVSQVERRGPTESEIEEAEERAVLGSPSSAAEAAMIGVTPFTI